MPTRVKGYLVLLSILIPLMLPISVALGSTTPQEVLVKVDPALYPYLASDQPVEVVVRVKPLPSEIATLVKGRYHLAVSALKSWAEYSQRDIVLFINALGGRVLNRFWLDNVVLAEVPGRAILKIAAHKDVVRVFRNFEVQVIEPVERVSLDPKEFTGKQVSSWGIFKIRAPDVWNMGYTGTGVRIAVLDTGVDITHPALAGKMLTVIPGDPYYPGGWMAFDSAGNPYRTTPYDTHGHGTHCSGTALGGDTTSILIGVAPGATLMHGLVLPGGSGTFAQVLAGMEWTVEPYYLDAAGNRIYTGLPAHVVSMSFGASEYYGNELLPAIQAMLLANIVPVAAIGNGGVGTTSNPGNIWGVFGIGATDINDAVATWSSGKVVTWPSPPPTWPFFDTYPSTYIKPDFSAPGVSITSSVPGGGYEAWSGTSMATPHVAGLVALILQAAGWYITPVPDTPEKVYLILNSTALDLGDPGQDIRYGWGRVDAYEAVMKALEYAKKSGVEGFVLDEVTGEPVTWATVTVVEVDLTVPVNKTGGFKIPLDPGNYTLVFSAWGYYNVTVEVEVVLLNGTITGIVYNAITNVPVPGALVTVVELDLTTLTDENGVFTVSVPPGRYNLTVSAPGYSPYSTTVTVDEAELVYLDIPLFPVGNGTIAGYVVEAGTGIPVVDAVVWTYVAGELVYNYTDSAGYYELNVPSGIYTVYAYKPGYVQANVTGVIVAPEAVTWVNITLEKIPPTVVVLANVDYYTRPHLKDIVSSLGLPVVEYNNMTKLLEDWINGLINPAVVIIDHTMPSPYSYPPADIVLLFHLWADAVGSSLIWLGTSYSGYTGIDVLFLYNTTLVTFGYPAPNSRLIGYPSVAYVQVTMLNMTHPIFSNVTPDIPPNVFYLATGLYADYAIYNFTDPTGRFTILAYVNDTRPGFGRFGVGVAEWISNTGIPWYYLGSWAESYWMQYLEPGADGMYTNNTQKVLENAILLGWSYAVGSQGTVNRDLLPQVLTKIAFFLEEQSYSARKVVLEPQLYTPVTVYLPRLPHGYITGRVVGADDVILEGAVVEVLDTPVKLTTNATGHFYTWLPVGTYTLRISAPGYKPRLINVTVEEGVLLDLGDVILPTVLRIATLYDYGDALKRLFEERGWYARSYTNISQLTDDILAGMYHVVVYAGYYGVPFPTADEFFRFLNATFEKGVGVVWMDSWGTYGYGIKVLNRYLGDPPVVGSSWGYPVYIRVTRPHPILRGYSVGQDVLIVTYSSADFSWFTGFSGEAIADTVAGGVVRGNSIAWKIFDNGVKWVLLSSFAPTQWNLPTYFTTDAWNIICNAVLWVASKPLNVVVDKPYVRVGETISINITGGPALTEIIVAFAGEEIGRVITDEQGNAFLTYTIPLIPGGEYTLEAYTEDQLYYGYTEVTIVPDLKVHPLTVRAPGTVYVEATGLMPYQTVYIYLDGNWLSFVRANISGAFSLVLNIPLVAEGYHSITLIDPDTGEDIASQVIMVTSQLDEITNIVVDIRDKLIALEPVILSIDGNVAMVLTKLGIIEVDVAEIKQVLEEQNAVLVAIKDDVAIIRTDVGVVRARVEALYPILLSIQGYVVLVLTQLGEIRSDLRTIMSMIESSRDAVISEIRGGVAELKLYMNESTTTLLIKLDSLTSLVESSRSAVIERIENGTATLRLELAGVETRIKAKLDALEPVLIRVNETTATILTRIGVLETNVSSILRSLAELNATITRVSGDVATVITSIGELRVNVSNLVDYLRSVNATITGLIVDSRGAVLAQITTTQGVIQADLSTINSLIKAGLPISTAELRDFIDKLVRDTSGTLQESVNTVSENVQSIEARLSELEKRIENIEQASGRIEQAGVYSIAGMVLVIVAILLLAYQVVLLRKPK